LTEIDRRFNKINASHSASVKALAARNTLIRSLFLFDARRMLLSLMCADECGVVWPYLLKKGDKDGVVAPDNVETIRAEFAVVVEERRLRRVAAAVRNRQVAPGVAARDARAAKRRRTNR
jgi:hypothetical protein